MKLYITEKKSVAEAFSVVLGKKSSNQLSYVTHDGSVVTWLSGHVLELVDAKDYDAKYAKWSLEHLPILPDPFVLRPPSDKKVGNQIVVNNSFKRKILENAVNLISKASEVILATDPDAEGELLGREVIEYSGYKGRLTRILPTSLEPADIQKTIDGKFPAEHTQRIGEAGLARSHIDWIIGINSTVALTAYNQNKINTPLNCGRVQTAIINMLHLNHLSRKNFVSRPVYFVLSDAYVDGVKIELKYVPTQEERVTLDSKRDHYNPDEAKQLVEELTEKLSGKDGVVSSCIKSRKKKGCPKGYSLSDLQIDISKNCGISAAETLAALQSLYDKKFVTYPRTDNNYFPEDAHAHAPTIVRNLQEFTFSQGLDDLDVHRKNAYWDTSKFDNHHAIIPTRLKVNFNALNKNEQDVYQMVAKRYLAQFMPDYEFDSTTIVVDIEGHIFRASGNITVEMGWKKVLRQPSEGSDDGGQVEKESKTLPIIEEGILTTGTKIFISQTSTKIPALYNEASLLQALKKPSKFIESEPLIKILKERNKGIGRESTRATILKTMERNSFFEYQKKNIALTKKGLVIAEIAPPMLLDLALTAKLEESFGEIEKGKLTYKELMDEYRQSTYELVESVKRGECELTQYLVKTEKCFQCRDGKMTQRRSFGNTLYWRCCDCGSSFSDNQGQPTPRSGKESCPKCSFPTLGRFLHKGSQNTFGWYCRNCKTSLPDLSGKPILKLHRCASCHTQINYGYSTAKKVSYWRCSKTSCGVFYSDQQGVPQERKKTNEVYNTSPCPKCHGGLLRQMTRRKDGHKFWLCSNRDVAEVSCQASFDDNNNAPDTDVKDHACPSCKSGLLKRREYKGRYFWGCTNWKHVKQQCKFTTKDNHGTPLLILN